MNALSPPPHIQPKTGRECPYMAIGVCNKCGWCAPSDVPDVPAPITAYPKTIGVVRSQVKAAIEDWHDEPDRNYANGISITDAIMTVVGPVLEQIAAEARASERDAVMARVNRWRLHGEFGSLNGAIMDGERE